MKKLKFWGLGIFVALLVLPFSVSALEYRTDESVNINKSRVTDGGLYAMSDNIVIDGVVDGDLICFGSNLLIEGTVKGDVICGSDVIIINGVVEGSVRVVGDKVTITGSVGRNLNVVAGNLNLSDNASIGLDIILATQSAQINGNIKGGLYGYSGLTNITSEIGRNVYLYLSKLDIGGDAVLSGDLKYISKNDANIEDGVIILGDTIHDLPNKGFKDGYTSVDAFKVLYYIFANLIIGLFIVSLFKGQTKKIVKLIREKQKKVALYGLFGIFVVPFISLLLMITIIGIPAAIITFAIWGILLYVAKIFSAIVVGKLLLKKFKPETKFSLIIIMSVGVSISCLAFSLPVVGWVAAVVATCCGMGGILLSFKE